MNRILCLTFSGILLCSAVVTHAQQQPYGALNRRIIKEKDILWKKRVWRDIDANDKQNINFRYHTANAAGTNFLDILLKGLDNGSIKAYADERFVQELSKEQVEKITAPQTATEKTIDPASGEIKTINADVPFAPETICKFRIKEDWIFDKTVGKVETRIIAIAPLRSMVQEDGSTALQPMCWIYYPAASETLATVKDDAGIRWLDVFEKRTFASTILKISNPFAVAESPIQTKHN